MAFLALPVEILQRMTQYTLPEGFESLALSCKHMYNICDRFRTQHNDFRKKYRCFNVNRQNNAGTNPSVELLRVIAKDPIVASYVEVAYLHRLFQPLGWTSHILSDSEAEEIAEVAKVVLEMSPYIGYAGYETKVYLQRIKEDLKQEFREGQINSIHLSALLLTQLPNVKELSLPTNFYNRVYRVSREEETEPGDPTAWHSRVGTNGWKLMDILVQRANDRLPGAALGKLKTLLPNTGAGYNNQRPMYVLTPFLALKSLESFMAGSCLALGDGYNAMDFKPADKPADGPLGVNLRSVELYGCIFQKREAKRFFGSMANLKSLKFSHETKIDGAGYGWSAGSFVQALVESPFVETLEDLTLDMQVLYGDLLTGVTSLQPFKNLTSLELCWRYMQGPPVPEDYKHVIGESADGEPEIPTLFELIPKSLERCEIFGFMHDENNQALEFNLQMLESLFHVVEPLVRPEWCKLKTLELRVGTREANDRRRGLKDTTSLMHQEAERWMQIVAAVEELGGEVIDLDTVLWEPKADFAKTFCERFQVENGD